MLSAGMLTDFASATIVRRRGLASGSPPPARAATVNSLMMRVNALPRLASAAPFLCLIVCHLEWPDIAKTPANTGKSGPDILPRGRHRAGRAALSSGCGLGLGGRLPAGVFRLPGQDDPHLGARVPGAAAVVAEQRRDLKARIL